MALPPHVQRRRHVAPRSAAGKRQAGLCGSYAVGRPPLQGVMIQYIYIYIYIRVATSSGHDSLQDSVRSRRSRREAPERASPRLHTRSLTRLLRSRPSSTWVCVPMCGLGDRVRCSDLFRLFNSPSTSSGVGRLTAPATQVPLVPRTGHGDTPDMVCPVCAYAGEFEPVFGGVGTPKVGNPPMACVSSKTSNGNL